MKKTLLAICSAGIMAMSGSVFAEAPTTTTSTDIGGNVNLNVTTKAVVVNAGISLGGHADLETSMASTHGDTRVGGDLNSNVEIGDLGGGLFGLQASVINAGASIGGDLCAKTSIGSLGSSSCSYR